jgi:GH15 family glucan-1,4-alpha-glucosidase
MTSQHRFIPYAPIERHAVTGNRRTAALVAADGTIDWLCLPAYDGTVVFGALLDADRGGFFRLGPAAVVAGEQRYVDDTAAVITRWADDDWDLELIDLMPWPQDDRASHKQFRHALLRRLRCTRGQVACVLDLEPRRDFAEPFAITAQGGQFMLRSGDTRLTLWASRPVSIEDGAVSASFELREGEELCVALEYGDVDCAWSCREINRATEEALVYWSSWAERLTYDGPRNQEVRRSALTVHLLSYAPTGSMVAAPTTSLPERVGGDRNYDYRFAWVRDASLSMAAMALVGDTSAAQRYMDWLVTLGSATDSPLQVVYRLDGDPDVTQLERIDLAGYRESRPVRFGNHAALQRQLDSLGYLADCALIYLGAGGPWQDSYWEMIRRTADYTVANWSLPDSGIWELPQSQHYVSSKVMSWVTLERSIRIAHQCGHEDETGQWRVTMDAIHAEVME